MIKAPKLVDMSKSIDEMTKGDCYPSPLCQDKYPYGLTLRFDNETLEKLQLDTNVEVGDIFHLFALAKITCVSKNDTGEGEKCNIEAQITHLGVESEDEEDQENEEQPLRKKYDIKNFYKDVE